MNRREALMGALGGIAATALPAMKAGAAPAQLADLRPPKNGPISIAFVIGTGANVMDLVGPWEAFQDTGIPGKTADDTSPGFRLGTVSDSDEPLEATGGMLIKPNFTYENVPMQPNIIVMGAQGEHTQKKIDWIRRASVKADLVMSVCTGAFLLAKTGLLDGLRATTHHEFYDSFEKQFPKVSLVRGPRYVENGKYACAGGLTSGIELALRVVQRYYGSAAASRSAYYMEYAFSPHRPTA